MTRTQGRLTERTAYDLLGRKIWQSSGFQPDALARGQGQLWRNYGYDAAGELAESHDGLRGSTQFSYDPAGYLTQRVNTADRQLESFAWDAAGNLLDDAQRSSRGYVEGNRLRMWQNLRFDYDAFGNLATKLRGTNQRQQFTYDGQDRLVAVRTHGARGVVETRFAYDPLGRRIAKTDTTLDVRGVTLREETKRFVWEGLRLAQEVRDTGVSSYVYSPDAPYTPAARVDAMLAEAMAATVVEQARRAARIYHFHTDLVGAPLEVTDEAGELAWAGRYGAWGRVETDASLLPTQRTEQPLRFAGQYADDSTGLHYNTFRFYDPDVGRFVSQDPIGLYGGENLYAYGRNAQRWIDPWGWCSVKLSNNMEKSGVTRPANSAAHHIVGDTSKEAAPARAILAKYGIDVDSELNGVFLPNRNNSDDLGGILHNGKHPNTYFQKVNQLIQNADLGGKQAVLDQLQTIRETLQNASRDMPWRSVLSEL
ncbi:RHS repeat-associated core domain protein [Burkholderia gladioli]|uniref:RHS repeat-associated core domain protein n=1 Tax=Burkholderia gladioli TaxID=28095 RepID=A0AAW3FA83_BURGA|nr:RHS repeat-associated core domain protein [Burkholderia gladioli]